MANRWALYRTQKHCAYCERRMLPPATDFASFPRTATIEHRIPTSRGGPNLAWNIILACRDCNQLKGDLTVVEFAAVVQYCRDNDISFADRPASGVLLPIATTLLRAMGYLWSHRDAEAAE